MDKRKLIGEHTLGALIGALIEQKRFETSFALFAEPRLLLYIAPKPI